jgi:hypothetical protein
MNTDMWPSEVYVITPTGLSPKTVCTALLSTSSWTHDNKRQLPTTESPACAVDQTAAIATTVNAARPILTLEYIGELLALDQFNTIEQP